MTSKDPAPATTIDSSESITASQAKTADDWDGVSKLAGKMGEVDADDPARQELLDFVESLDMDREYSGEEEQALRPQWDNFLEKMSAGGYWRDKEIVEKLAKKLDAAPYNLCQVGMPAEVILEDEEYYSEMIEDEYYGLELETIGDFYKIMSATPEGKEKFRKDFVEGKDLDYRMTMWLGEIFASGACSEAELEGMKAFKESGVSLVSRTDWLCSEYGSDPFHDPDYHSKNRALGTQFASFLLANGLFDAEDARVAYERALENPGNDSAIGIIDTTLQTGMSIPEDSSEDVKYWHQLSQTSGTNQIADFLARDIYRMDEWAERIQQDFDFSAAPVQRLFARDQATSSGIGHMGDFTSPKFLDALRTPGFQTIIMDTIEERQNSKWPYSETPTLFLMLARDRAALDDMLSRGVFQNYPGCQAIDPIGKLARGEFTEKDRLSLFVKPINGHSIDEFFDENGRPRQLLVNELYKGSVVLSGSNMLASPSLLPEYFLDKETLDRLHDKQEISAIISNFKSPWNMWMGWRMKYFNGDPFSEDFAPKPEFWQKCLEVGEIDFLARQDTETLASAGFDETTLNFINFRRRHPGSQIGYIEPDEIHKYFDESGPKPEFWQKCLEVGDYTLLAANDSETIKNMGLGDAETQFVLGISKNDILQGEPISEDNILAILTRFIKMDADDWYGASDSDLLIREAFGSNEVKDLALKKIRELYEAYITGDSDTEIPAGIKMLYMYMVQQDGAGPLTQIESLLSFAGNIASAGEKGREFTREIERKMDKAHWTNQDKSNFYAISAEVLQASPDLYLEFAELFANIPDKKDFETFMNDIYPLFRAKLALLKNYEDHSNGIGSGYTTVSYSPADIEALRNQLHNALLPFNLQELSPDKRREGIDIVRATIFGEISELFQTKFGFLPGVSPSELTAADAKAIEDMTLYLSNIANPSERSRDLIGFYLALQFDRNGAWDKMRSGEDISPGDFLNVASAFNVSEAIRVSRANDPVNAETTRIESPERLRSFKAELQKETTTRRLGNVQTIDLRLQNLIGNIEELTDPDLYPDKIDKDRVGLLRRHPVKTIGKVAATMYQRMNGRDIPYGEGEENIANEMIQILTDNGIEPTADNIKAYFQSGLSGLKEPFSIMANIEREGAPAKIQELQAMLVPPDSIIRIFSKLGEDFRPQSGAMALSSDLDYLENLIVKHEGELSEEELSAAREYLNAIRSKMAELNSIYDKTAQNFSKMSKSVHSNAPAGVRSKMHDIDKIIGGAESEQVIVTTCTTSMTTIIENMRACLSCKTKGINNDTDLTFGEGYKFYLYSSSNTTRGDSSTDEIVYFVPVGEGESQRMGFVMDQMYGTKNSDIMISHLENVLKKARQLKEQFPEVPISIILPDSSMRSCGVSTTPEELSQKLDLPEGSQIVALEGAKVTVPQSGFGDHYIEFGDGGARVSGEKTVNGIEIIL